MYYGKGAHSNVTLVNLAQFENVVKEGDVTDGQSQDLDLGEFLVRRQSRQHAAQSSEGGVERLDANSFPGRVRCAVAFRGSSVTPAFQSAAAGRCHRLAGRAHGCDGALTCRRHSAM